MSASSGCDLVMRPSGASAGGLRCLVNQRRLGAPPKDWASMPIQNASYTLSQGGTGERFLQHCHARVKPTLVNDRIARESLDVTRSNTGSPGLHLFAKHPS